MYFKLPFIVKDENSIKNLKFDKKTKMLKMEIKGKKFEFKMSKNEKEKIILKSEKNIFSEKIEFSKKSEIKEIYEYKNLQDFEIKKSSQKKNVKILADLIFKSSIRKISEISKKKNFDFFLKNINTNYTSKISEIKFIKKEKQNKISLKKINMITITEKIPKIEKIQKMEFSENQKKLKKVLLKFFEKKPIFTFNKILENLKKEKIFFSSIYSLKSVLSQICYSFKNGPFKTSYIKLNYDPRISKNSLFFQIFHIGENIGEKYNEKFWSFENKKNKNLKNFDDFKKSRKFENFEFLKIKKFRIIMLGDEIDDRIKNFIENYFFCKERKFCNKYGWLDPYSFKIIVKMLKNKFY